MIIMSLIVDTYTYVSKMKNHIHDINIYALIKNVKNYPYT